MTRIARWVGPLAATLLLGPAFWLAGLRGSELPPTLAMTINLHGLAAPGYDGDSGRPMAPLSQQIITDARQDAGALSPKPSPSTPPSAANGTSIPTAQPSASAGPPSPNFPQPSPTAVAIPTPTALPVPTPTAVPLPTPTLPPLPTPTGVLVPTPSAAPLPTPSGLPLPTPTALPLPTPSGLPLPTPSGLPLPTPSGLPLPTPTALPLPTPSLPI